MSKVDDVATRINCDDFNKDFLPVEYRTTKGISDLNLQKPSNTKNIVCTENQTASSGKDKYLARIIKIPKFMTVTEASLESNKNIFLSIY